MITLNHIGIAVKEEHQLLELLKLLGLPMDHQEKVEDQKVITSFVPLPQKQEQTFTTSLELLKSTDEGGPIAQFIQKRGEGIHHLSFEVGSGELDPLLNRLKTAGYQLIYPEPRMGAHEMRVNFIHPKSTGGILIEVMEKLKV
jgi:methylmalonyl-CoA epimerase